jgi:hypothetical protein
LFYHCHNLESDDLWAYGLQLLLDDVQKELLIDRVQDTVLDIIMTANYARQPVWQANLILVAVLQPVLYHGRNAYAMPVPVQGGIESVAMDIATGFGVSCLP